MFRTARSSWGRVEVDEESVWGRCGADVRPKWGPFGVEVVPMFGWSRPPETHTDLRRSIVTGAMISRNVFLTTTRGQLADRKSCDTPLVFGCAMAPPTQTLYGGGPWSQVGADGLRSGCLAGGTEQEDGLHNAPLWSTPFRHLTRGEAWAPRDPQNQLHKGSAGPPGGCAEPPKGWPPMGTAEPPVGSAVSRPRPAFDEAPSFVCGAMHPHIGYWPGDGG